MRELLHSVALRAARYLEEIKDRRVAPSAEAVDALKGFIEPLPAGPTAPRHVKLLPRRTAPESSRASQEVAELFGEREEPAKPEETGT